MEDVVPCMVAVEVIKAARRLSEAERSTCSFRTEMKQSDTRHWIICDLLRGVGSQDRKSIGSF